MVVIMPIDEDSRIAKIMREIDAISKERAKELENGTCQTCGTRLVKGHCSKCKVTYFACATFGEAEASLKRRGQL